MKGREYGGQDPDYGFEGGIVDRATGRLIPDDEPVYLLRASDAQAVRALTAYSHGFDGEESRALRVRIDDFVRFKHEHPERMRNLGRQR